MIIAGIGLSAVSATAVRGWGLPLRSEIALSTYSTLANYIGVNWCSYVYLPDSA